MSDNTKNPVDAEIPYDAIAKAYEKNLDSETYEPKAIVGPKDNGLPSRSK